MNIIISIIVVAVILFVLDKRGTTQIFTSLFQPKYFRWYGGIFAWLIMFFLMAFLVNCVQSIMFINENPAAMSSAMKMIELAGMLIGIGYLYQIFITYSPSGTLYSPVITFLRLLIFKEMRVHTEDLFEIVHKLEVKKAEQQRKQSKKRKSRKPEPPPKKKRYFRQD